MGVALMGIAIGLGIPAPLRRGHHLGAYFGDKMFSLSDTEPRAAVSGQPLRPHPRHDLDHRRATLSSSVSPSSWGSNTRLGQQTSTPHESRPSSPFWPRSSHHPLYTAIPALRPRPRRHEVPSHTEHDGRDLAGSISAMIQGKGLTEVLEDPLRIPLHCGGQSLETAVAELPALLTETGITALSQRSSMRREAS